MSLAGASPAGTGAAHGSIFNFVQRVQLPLRNTAVPSTGHEEDINPLGLEPRDTRGGTGVPDHFSPRSSADENPRLLIA